MPEETSPQYERVRHALDEYLDRLAHAVVADLKITDSDPDIPSESTHIRSGTIRLFEEGSM
jgi:hypothetical protein